MEKRIFLPLLCLLQLTVLAAGARDQRHEDMFTRRIDTHCHYIPDFYSKLLRENNITAGGRPIPAWNVTSHLALMDSMNISLSIASISTPGAVIKEGFPVDQSRKLARQLNEYGYNLTKQYPTKFRFLATLTLPDVEGSVAEAIYALDELKAAGIILLASSSGETLGTSAFEPLYAELNKRNAVVFVHPGQSPCPSTDEVQGGLPPFVVDFLLDTTRAAVNLVYRNVTSKYPNVKFILAHSGGFLPFATFRATGTISGLTNWTPAFILSQMQKFYVDTAISGNEWALPSTLALLNASHLTYGSDYPFAPSSIVLLGTQSLDKYLHQNLNAKALEQVSFGSASVLFRHSLDYVDSAL